MWLYVMDNGHYFHYFHNIHSLTTLHACVGNWNVYMTVFLCSFFSVGRVVHATIHFYKRWSQIDSLEYALWKVFWQCSKNHIYVKFKYSLYIHCMSLSSYTKTCSYSYLGVKSLHLYKNLCPLFQMRTKNHLISILRGCLIKHIAMCYVIKFFHLLLQERCNVAMAFPVKPFKC